MISNDFAVQQLVRISRLRNAPDPATIDGKIQAEEVVKALQTVARSESDAEKIIDEFVRKSVYFPAPAEIYALEKHETLQPWKQKETQCNLCGDTGFVSEERFVKPDDPWPYSFAVPCSCRKAPRQVPAPPPPDRRSMSADPELSRQLASGKGMR